MASAFIGLEVAVVLKGQSAVLNGLVADVKDQQLYLRDVHFVQSGKRFTQYTIHGADIADIEVLPAAFPSTLSRGQDDRNEFSPTENEDVERISPSEFSGGLVAPPKVTNQPLGDVALPKTKTSARINKPLTDPAILSFTRTYSHPQELSNENVEIPEKLLNISRHPSCHVDEGRSFEVQKNVQGAAVNIRASHTEPSRSAIIPTTSDISQLSSGPQQLEDANESFLVDPLAHVAEENSLAPNHLSLAVKKKAASKRRKRGKTKPKIDLAVTNEVETSPENFKKEPEIQSNGWRKTPILQPQAEASLAPSLRSVSTVGKIGRQALATAAKRSKKQRDLEREASGWATEDASDIHGMGDFDFEANLSQFDKLAIWDELRNGDTTADEDRLVSLNRVKPAAQGTFGVKKLLPSENVLDRARPSSPDLDGDGSENEFGLGQRVTSRRMLRDLSKGSNRQISSSRVSLRAPADSTGAGHSAPRSAPIRSLSQAKNSDSHGGASPKLQGRISPGSSTVLSPSVYDGRNRACLRYLKTDNICRTMTPEHLEAVEILAHNGFGMSEEILAENAGRCIAEIALSTLSPKGQRLAQVNHNSLPVIVVLVGDNKAGGRALAASRHLLERNVRVVASLTGPVDLDNGPLSSQVHRFRGKILRSWTETIIYLKTLDAPPELIIDALLGVELSLETLENDHLSTATDMITWANNSRASILSIDLPSGVDQSSKMGEARSSDQLEMRAKAVICCGAPSSRLLDTMIARFNSDDWRVIVADIGINPAARPFLKMNTNKEESNQRGKYVHFGSGWVVHLRYDAGGAI